MKIKDKQSISSEERLSSFMNTIMYDFPIGPKCLKVAHVINVQKVGMPLFLLYMAYMHGNNSEAMWTYGVMHGSYGILWFMKHCAFPDHTFEQYQTIGSAAFLCVLLGAYCVPAYLLATGQCYRYDVALDQWEEPSKLRRYGSILMYIMGVSLTLASDCQKTITLRYVHKKPHLISSGLFSYTRSPNYFGEILLYSSFATLTNHWLSYLTVVILPCFTIFPARIWQKEMSLRKKPGWTEYEMRSNVLVPRVFGLGDIPLIALWIAVLVYQAKYYFIL
jgi:protein-S-isoprenylcysteine O-methyltransferase Ste14